MIYGYARVSTRVQALDGNSLKAQGKELKKNGCEKIFYESYTGTVLHRPKLDELLNTIVEGDTIVCCKLDRLARNTKEGIQIIDIITKGKGCKLWILNMGVFDNTAMGKLMRTMMLAFAEYERDMIVQRTQEGKAMARKLDEGYKEGRPYSGEVDKGVILTEFRRHIYEGKSVSQICRELGFTRQTWYNRLKQYNIGQWDYEHGEWKRGTLT